MRFKDQYLAKRPTVLDLFCGCGGLSLGFEKAGFNITAGIDKYHRALETWDRNHSGETYSVDLSSKNPEDLAEEFADVNVVVGGPPCKDFSKTNQKVDLGRNNLVVLFSEFVSAIEPESFVIENVRQLTTKYDDVLESVRERLSDKYNIAWRLLDSADYGVPQHRIRAFVIGIKGESEPKFPEPTHGPDSQSSREIITAGEAITDISPPDSTEEYKSNSKHAELLTDIPEGMNYSFYTEKMGHPNPRFEWRSRFSDYLYKADPDKPVRTLKAKPGAASGPFHWENRRFTKDELKRLQGFPDDFEFSTDSYSHITRMIGNSVPPIQSYTIALALKKQINSDVELMRSDRGLDFNSRRRTSTEEYEQKARSQIEDLYDD